MNQANNNPESPLPWRYIPTWQDYSQGPDQWKNKDYEYVIHACNAYPKLIKALKDASFLRLHKADAALLLSELGEWNQ